jgi:DNA-binding MarR family transcriptional regulator
MRDELPSLPGYALRRAANATMAQLAARLAPLDLRQADASALILIGDNPGVTSSALGRALDIQRANMVPLLKKLEDARLLERAPIDGKSLGLSLTAAGMARRDEALGVIRVFEMELIERVPPEHRAHLLPALNALWQEEG